MSENAIRAQAPTDSLEQQAAQHGAAAGTTAVVRAPGVLRTTVLLARVTFREAARRKILWIAALAGGLFLVLFWTGLHAMLKSTASLPVVGRREGISMMLMMALYASSI
jgi:hypothetical protein